MMPLGGAEIITAFLEQDHVESPLTYITQIAHESSGYHPIYYFMKLANISLEDTISHLASVVSRSQGKKKMLERLTDHEIFYEPIKSSTTYASDQKSKFRTSILTKDRIEIPRVEDVRYYCGAIRSLNSEDIDFRYILPQLLSVFNTYYETRRPSSISTDLKKAICHLDIIQNEM